MTLLLFLYFIIPIIMAVVIVMIKSRSACVTLHWDDCDVVVHRAIARRLKN
jgi:hypothetical protein